MQCTFAINPRLLSSIVSKTPSLEQPQASLTLTRCLSLARNLVVQALEIRAQLLNRIRGGARLHGLGVVCDEESLFCLDDYDAFFALH